MATFPCEVLAITRIELSRIFLGCPALRRSLASAAGTYPSDEELLRIWRHDDAWSSYRAELTRTLANPPGRLRGPAGGGRRRRGRE